MTAAVATMSALMLAGVFAVAAAAKLARPAAVGRTFAELGLPAPAAMARAVPTVEAALVVALLVSPLAGGVAALVLLGAFSVVLGRALFAGSTVTCGCFGSGRTEPVSSADLLRNAMLGGLAVLATGAAAPVRPTLAAAVTVTGLFAAGALVLALAQLASTTGSWWRVRVPDLGSADDEAATS